MKNLKLLWIPVIAPWFVLVLNIILLIIGLIMNIEFGGHTIRGFEGLAILFWSFLIILFIIIFGFGISSAILINMSVYKKKYNYYITGIILNLIYDLIVTITIGIFHLDKEFLIILFVGLLIQWTQFFILIAFSPKVILLSVDTSLDNNLVPKEEQLIEQNYEERPE